VKSQLEWKGKMAKDKKKASRADKGRNAGRAAARNPRAAADGHAPKLDEKLARGVNKRIHKLQDSLSKAAKLERKRVRALERARNRRQLIEAALDELRPVKAAAPTTDLEPATDVAAGGLAEPAPAAATAPASKPFGRRSKAGPTS